MGMEKEESTLTHLVGCISFFLLQRVFFSLPRGKVAQFYFVFLTKGASVCIYFSLSHRKAQFDLFFLTEGSQFACFSPSLRRGNRGVFFLFLKRGAHCPWYFPTVQRGGVQFAYFYLIPRGGRHPAFFFLYRGGEVCVFSHYQRRAQFPSFKGFEFKETRFHLYIMHFNR